MVLGTNMKSLKKILVAGFSPFCGDSFNPSFEAVKLLPDRIKENEVIKAELPVVFEGAEVIKAELPVVFEDAENLLQSLIEEHKPNAILCTGLAGGRNAITPEVIAVNLRSARIPDNSGRQPVWEKIVPDGPDGLFSSLPVRRMVDALTAEDIPAALSFSAGTFVCNEVMYQVLLAQREHFPEMQAGFVHVPYAEEFPHPEGKFAMPLKKIVKGLGICVRCL